MLKWGVENFDTELLKKEGRFTVSRDDQLEKIKEIKSKNIAISAMYIIGFPSDTKDSMKNFKLCNKVKYDLCSI